MRSHISQFVDFIRSVILYSIIYSAVSFLINHSINWTEFAYVATIVLISSLYFRFLPQGSFLRDVMPLLVSLGIAALSTKLLRSGAGEEFTWISYIQFVSILVTISLPIQIWGFRASNT